MARVLVVGGGPAGLMAAEAAASAGCAVSVLERMPSVGRKFLLAGRGGLNLTHSEALPAFLAHYRGDAWIRQVVAAWSAEALRDWVHGLGIETFTGSSGRVFPVGLKTSPLLRAWLGRLAGLGVEVRTRHQVSGLLAGPAVAVMTPDGPLDLEAEAVVLALGGASWPRLGSDGAWRQWLSLPCSPFSAANVGMVVPWNDARLEQHAGAPLKPVMAWVANAPQPADRAPRRGECILTADGLEGGVIYSLNAALRAALAADGRAELCLDLLPDLSLEALAGRLAAQPGRRSYGERLRRASGADPAKLALLAAARRASEPGTRGPAATHLSLQDTKTLCVSFAATRPIAEAISTDGGLSAATHDDSGMLLAHPGVWVAGEMIDWDAPTGGYLLTACFASGRAAGAAAARYARRSSEGKP